MRTIRRFEPLYLLIGQLEIESFDRSFEVLDFRCSDDWGSHARL
jgi:hypothetical protein